MNGAMPLQSAHCRQFGCGNLDTKVTLATLLIARMSAMHLTFINNFQTFRPEGL